MIYKICPRCRTMYEVGQENARKGALLLLKNKIINGMTNTKEKMQRFIIIRNGTK